MESMKKAEYMARKAIESTYIGVCTVQEYRHGRDENGKSVKSYETVLEGCPCRLSFQINNYSKVNPVFSGDTVSEIKQTVKLFIAPDIGIKPGSKIIVTQNGVTTAYRKSGQPSVYFSHQEIMLELFDDKA